MNRKINNPVKLKCVHCGECGSCINYHLFNFETSTARYSSGNKKKCVCKNCKWWKRYNSFSWGICNNSTVIMSVSGEGEREVFMPEEIFGCNQWEKKE